MAHYRFTVEVEDNGRMASGSAVQEEDCVFNDGLLKMGNALNCGVKGGRSLSTLARGGCFSCC
jgi:hypothetical protein